MKARKVSGKSPAREKMVEVMTLKGLSSSTRTSYQSTASMLALQYGRAPQELSGGEIRARVLGRIDRGLAPRTTIAGLRYFVATEFNIRTPCGTNFSTSSHPAVGPAARRWLFIRRSPSRKPPVKTSVSVRYSAAA